MRATWRQGLSRYDFQPSGNPWVLTSLQKHEASLFPAVGEPDAEVLAQAALYVVLRERPQLTASPWSLLAARRFGGDVYERFITLQTGDASEPIAVHVSPRAQHTFDVTVRTADSERVFRNISAHLVDSTTLSVTIDGARRSTTVVAHVPSASASERLHVFHGSRKTMLHLPAPSWLLALGGDARTAARGALRAPMPSVVVDVRVNVGDRVQTGDPVVVLESMKTETVLRALVAGVVRAVGCKKGEMVEEGRELVDVEPEEVSS